MHSRPNQHTSPHYRVCPTIGNRTNPIRISITLLCAHWQLHSRPISTLRLITASARPPAAARRHDLTNPQRYCAPPISSRAPTSFAYQLRYCALIGSCTPGRISTLRLITASARPPAAARRHDLTNPQRYCAPLISSSSNLIRILMTLLCAHRRSHSRPISMPRLITASARPPVAAQT